ncbi:hypothetical protein Tco_0679868 [Tanacetum coccineum]|uniref:MAK10-like protein n=1 Tax=Tanacetum coccineum TaxID=301880 RepID=A0ABQ4XJ10_9ASTR
MGDANPIRTLGDYSKPSHEGYRNTIELPVGNNVVPLRSDTLRLVQNGCSFHKLRFEDPNHHLKDFLKLMDSLDLDGANRERTRLLIMKPIRHIQDFDELKDHCLTLKNTSYPHQRYAAYNTLVNKEEPTGFTSIRRIQQRRYNVSVPALHKLTTKDQDPIRRILDI